MHRRSLAIFLLISTAILRCSSIPTECSGLNFEQTGFADAKSGREPSLDRIEACGEVATHDYQAGYERGRAYLCSAPQSNERARSLGERGLPSDITSATAFEICGNADAHYEKYEKAYASGLAQFCSVDRARNLGGFSGGRGEAPLQTLESFGICGSARENLWGEFQNGYRRGLRQFCSKKQFASEGYLQGLRGDGQRLITTKLDRCDVNERERLISAFDQSFLSGLSTFCGEQTLRQMAGRSAQMGGDGSLPASLLICASNFSNIEEKFLAQFRKERARFVKSHCHYEGGATRGREDAATLNEPVANQVPAFCDDEHYDKYREGYLTEWKRVKDIYCNLSNAYDQGIKDAAGALEMKITIPDHCPPDYKASMIRRYQEGYRYATNRTPLVPKEAD